MVQLEPGDFLYQSDQELFLATIEEREDSYVFAVHGWREIDKERVAEYIDDERSKVHRGEEVEKMVMDNASDEQQQRFEKLQQVFEVYEDASMPEDGPQEHFTLEDT